MGSHPLNLMFRFFLEIIALVSVGIWGWQIGEGPLKYVLAIGLPILIALIWGVFAVPGDPSRSGKAPVPVPGLLRLLLEFAVFGLAGLCLFNMGYTTYSLIFVLLVVIHYALSYDRMIWLLKQK